MFRAVTGAGTARLRAGLNIAHVGYPYFVDLDIEPTPAADVFHCEDCDHILLRNVTFTGGMRPVEGVPAAVAHETVKVNQSTHFYIEDSRIGGADDNAIDFVAVQQGHIVRIPNQHVFLINNVVFNPEGAGSQWQHFQIAGEFAGGPAGAGAPGSNRADNDLRIAGNVIWNGPSGHPLGSEMAPGARRTMRPAARRTSTPTTP